MSNKEHWENIYSTKAPNEVSWTQAKPKTSLDLIAKFDLPKYAKIIDVGGGDSLLVDSLVDLGYTNVSVLDISKSAIQRAKNRLGNKAVNVTWIVSDIVDFKPIETYDLWHDRAAFHFLTKDKHIEIYLNLVKQNTRHIALGTFSSNGPLKCSSLEISQYNKDDIEKTFGRHFEMVEYFTVDHQTPFNTLQNFSFARLTRLF